MISQIFLILFQIQIIQNSSPKKLYGIKYAIPLIYNSNVYFFGYKKIIYTKDLSSFEEITSKDLTNEHLNTFPLYYSSYIITYVKYDKSFKLLKKKIGNSIESISEKVSDKKLKEDGNVCLFQMIFQSTYYYYYAWTDSDSYINIARINFNNLYDISSTKSNEKNNGATIDCKAFSNYGDIICVYVTSGGCVINLYDKNIYSTYSNSLKQRNYLSRCNLKSKVQKIYNIDGNKFIVCYNVDKSYYCLFGEHKSTNSITIKTETNTKLLDSCDPEFYRFFIGSISSNYIIVCTNSDKIHYIIFNEVYETIYDKYSYSKKVSAFSLSIPYVFTFNSKTHLIFNYKKTFIFNIDYYTERMDLDYKFPICNILSTSPKISINTAIAINIINDITYFASDIDNSNKIKKIIEIPKKYITSSNYKNTY